MAISDRITSIEEHIKESYQELEGIGIDTTGVNNNLENIPKLIDGYWETLPKVTGEGTSITLDNTKEGKMKINLKGNTSQEGTPTPESPQDIHVVSGDNEIVINGSNFITFKNLSEVNQNGITTTPNNSELKLNGTVTQADPILSSQNLDLMLPKGTYTIIYKISSGSVTRPTGDVAFYLRNGTTNIATVTLYQILSNNNTFSQTFTIDNNASLYFYSYSNTRNIVFNNTVLQIQLSKGTTATNFEQYIGNTYNIDLPEGMELCKIGNYQDTIVKDNGKWYVKKEVGKFYSNSTTGWADDTNHRYYRAIDNIVVPPNNDTVGQGFCNVGLVTANQTLITSTTPGLAIHPISRLYISEVVYNNIPTTPILLYYAYITPTITEITDSTLISQLNALAKSYTSQTNISQESNDLASLLNATALREM